MTQPLVLMFAVLCGVGLTMLGFAFHYLLYAIGLSDDARRAPNDTEELKRWKAAYSMWSAFGLVATLTTAVFIALLVISVTGLSAH